MLARVRGAGSGNGYRMLESDKHFLEWRIMQQWYLIYISAVRFWGNRGRKWSRRALNLPKLPHRSCSSAGQGRLGTQQPHLLWFHHFTCTVVGWMEWPGGKGVHQGNKLLQTKWETAQSDHKWRVNGLCSTRRDGSEAVRQNIWSGLSTWEVLALYPRSFTRSTDHN